MQLLHEPSDPFILEDLQYIAFKALESPQNNLRVNLGTITLNCTANVLASQSVTFQDAQKKNNLPYRKSTIPFLLLFINPTTTSSKNTPSYASLTNTGFTAQVYSDTTQTITLTYIAIGQS